MRTAKINGKSTKPTSKDDGRILYNKKLVHTHRFDILSLKTCKQIEEFVIEKTQNNVQTYTLLHFCTRIEKLTSTTLIYNIYL